MNRWWIALLLPAEALACARQAAPQSLPRPPSPVLAQAMKPRPPESAPLRPPDLTPPVALRSPDLTIRSVTGRPGIYHHAIAGVAFLPGGRLLTNGADGSLRVWRFDDASLLREQPPRADEKGYTPQRSAVSTDGALVAVYLRPGKLDVFDVATGRLVLQLNDLRGLRDAVFTGPRTLVLLEAPEQEELERGHAFPAIGELERHRDIDAVREPDRVRAIDAVGGRTLATLVTPGAVAIAPSSDGRRLAIAGRSWLKVVNASLVGDVLWTDDRTRICVDEKETSQDQLLWFLNHKCRPRLLWNGDGSRLVEVAGTIVTVFDGARGKRVWEAEPREFPGGILHAALSSDGKLAISGDSWSCLMPTFGRYLDARVGARVGRLFESARERPHICTNLRETRAGIFSPDGKLYLAWVGSGLKVFDAERADRVHLDGGHSGSVNHLAPAPDGKRLLSASDDGSVRLWEGTRELRRWRADTGYVAFTPQGDRFVMSAWDPQTFPAQAVFIDPTSGAELLRIPQISNPVLSPDGLSLADLGVINGLCLYDARSGARRWCQKPGAVNSASVLAFLPRQGGVVATDAKYNLWVWSLADGARVRSLGESFTHVFLPIGDPPTSAVVEQRGAQKGGLRSLAPGAGPTDPKLVFPPPVAVSPDGRYLLSLWRDLSFGMVYVVRLRDGVVIDSLDPCLSDEIFSSAAWSPDGARIHLGSWRGRLYEVDFDRAAAESAVPYVPTNEKTLEHCHAVWN